MVLISPAEAFRLGAKRLSSFPLLFVSHLYVPALRTLCQISCIFLVYTIFSPMKDDFRVLFYVTPRLNNEKIGHIFVQEAQL